jgi:hypothetical protein
MDVLDYCTSLFQVQAICCTRETVFCGNTDALECGCQAAALILKNKAAASRGTPKFELY